MASESPNPQVIQSSLVRSLLVYMGEDPDREGLADTPKRYLKAMKELTRGYDEDPAVILDKTFSSDCDQMVVVQGIEFHSMCEHHILPFHGTATVGYIPSGKVVGLSKIPRLVQCFARRLQIQEQMTQQIARAMSDHIPGIIGVGVRIVAHHSCMGMRGVECNGTMSTTALTGTFLNESKQEFLASCQ